MKKLNILIGAGFSFNAGLPMASNIAEMFSKDFEDRLLRLESQWFWADGKDGVFRDNGSLDSDVLAMPLIMNEIVAEYSRIEGSLLNYEAFYAFLMKQDEEFFRPLVERARIGFFKKYPNAPVSVYSYAFDTFTKWNVIELINYLIADLLQSSKSDVELIAAYAPFLNFIETYDQINIYSTNHDLILERLLTKLQIKYDDGFSSEESELVHFDTLKPIKIFQNIFGMTKINLVKIHGSIDMIRYTKNDDINGVRQYSGYLYFKPETRDEMHYPARIDMTTKQIIQHPPNTILPMFITGSNKLNRLLGDDMYSLLLGRMREDFSLPADTVIIGYSYSDDHVNDIIKTIPKDTHIRNINPGQLFPFCEFPNVDNFHTMESDGVFGERK